MRTEQTKKEMQAKECVEMTVEELTVIMQLIDQGMNYFDHFRPNAVDYLFDTGHSKTEFRLDKEQLHKVRYKFTRQYMDAVLDNVEGVVF